MKNMFEQIAEYEKKFSANNYDGEIGETHRIIGGNIPIMLSVPHAVNHFRNGEKKWADLRTGGIALYLRQTTGCHLICNTGFAPKDPNFDAADGNDYQADLRQYLQNRRIYVLFDLHGSSAGREYAVELGTAPSPQLSEDEKQADLTSLHGLKFIEDIVIATFEQNFKTLQTPKTAVWKNRVFSAGGQNTVTKNIAESTDTACLQLEINAEYRNPDNPEQFGAFITSMQQIINKLAAVDRDELKGIIK